MSMSKTREIDKKDSTGKLLLLGIQHVFAMFGATVLVPAITGMNPAIALLAAGIGTWIFHLITGRKVPTFLGSSFAFIGGIIGAANAASEAYGISYAEAMPYATGGILVAGALYVVFALIVKLVGATSVLKLFPPVITGPMIIIIGLMLAPTAISSINTAVTLPFGAVGDAITAAIPVWQNWLVASITIAIIIGVALFAKGIFKLIPILFGILGGYLVAMAFGMVNLQVVNDAKWFALPEMFLPKFSTHAIMLIAPLAIVTFVEHIGDITASSAVVGKNFMEDPGLHRTLLGDGVATMFAGLIGGPANTTYSENTGVLATTKNYNPVTLEIAATVAILLAFIGKLGAVLQSLPGAVTGGVSVVLFGMIAAVGLRTLVENQVDFKQTRNLLIASVMLVLGLGGVSVSIPLGATALTFNGVALAAILGILLNLVLPAHIEKE